MDCSDKKIEKGKKKHPQVPIKTYNWEDVRRSRRKGGYPWTYLYKEPFEEDLDPEPYTMEGMRKSKSTSTVGKSENLSISEVTDFDGDTSTISEKIPESENLDAIEIITEPDEHSTKPASSSVLIEECEHKPKIFMIDSAESSDDISQYLDKEERVPSKDDQILYTPDETNESENKDEDSSTRKRKLSAESGYSRISQTKSAILKKIQNAKSKIKVPKLSFATKIKKPVPKTLKSSPTETKKDIKKSPSKPKNVQSVYTHIPLKPPSGQTDEFSYLEFEDKTQEVNKNRKPTSFKAFAKNIKQLQGNKENKQLPEDIKEDIEDELKQNEMTHEDDLKKDSSTSGDNKNFEENASKLEIKEPLTDHTSEIEELDLEEQLVDTDEDEMKNEDHTSEIQELDLEEQLVETDEDEIKNEGITTVEKADDKVTTDDDIFDQLFKASTSLQQEPPISEENRLRSKSAEPERKRKYSLESSYSRKSLSKLGIMKKLKSASDKIRNTILNPHSKKQSKSKEEVAVKVEKPKQLKPRKSVEPVYIHIPLKLPEGQTDEFSFLEKAESSGSIVEQPAEVEADDVSTPPDSPAQASGVQFIILTAPSDDEILDYNSSDVPETPSSDNKLFFGGKINELKELAKGVVDVVATPTDQQALAPVSEESNSDKVSVEEEMDENELKKSISTQAKGASYIQMGELLIDEEDGLNETKIIKETREIREERPKDIEFKEILPRQADVKPIEGQGFTTSQPVVIEQAEVQSQELKSSLKTEGSPPTIKKKVSFKRRSKTPKDDSYEDVQITELPADSGDIGKDNTKPQIDISQSMSVDEEKTYLDEKVIKTTSLDDDYNKWSKISDHEYEPVNPPPDNVDTIVMPAVYVIDTDCAPKRLPLTNNSLENSVTIEEINTNNVESYRPNSSQPESNANASVSFSSEEEANQTFIPTSKESPSKFHLALKQKTENLKNKLHNMKKPNISLRERPKFRKPNLQKFKIEKPKFNLPKLPDTAKISFPSFSKLSAKRPLKERQQSTESNDGDSKKPIFSFSTYPRIFKKKPKASQVSDFATVPRTKKDDRSKPETDETRYSISVSDSVRLPLHTEDSIDTTDRDEPVEESKTIYFEDSADINEPSHIRYDADIDIDDEYERENDRDFVDRWDRGRFNAELNDEYIQNFRNSGFKVTDLDSPEDISNQEYDYRLNNNSSNNKDNYSSGSSLGVHRPGVIEEINSDEFFVRQKGISQDNIDMGMYLSSEIREAFRTPVNALSQMEHTRNYDIRGSNQSLTDTPRSKKKSIKKPKRKKTPHTSQEKISYTEESAEDDSSPPSRPKRRSKRTRNRKQFDDIVPYQETIPVDANAVDGRFAKHRESLGILGDDEQDEEAITYLDEDVDECEQSGFKVTNSLRDFEREFEGKPEAPPRKEKSVKSLNLSENDSILGDFNIDKAVNNSVLDAVVSEIEPVTTAPILNSDPKKPSRISRASSQSQPNEEIVSLSSSANQIPCVEEPCVKDIRDSMGYAIIDKQKPRDPPLPPPRIPSRRKRSLKEKHGRDGNFFTVPRSRGKQETPVRPLRNYSTLSQAIKINKPVIIYENNENIDITQYIEIEEEPNRDLQSGDIIKRMKDRPLPAPPRPPRKARPLRDITSQENIMSESNTEVDKEILQESEVSTQTEPLPDDFVCEEVVQEPTDKIISSSTTEEKLPKMVRRLITPSYYTHEETITHGSLLVQPLDGAKILEDSEFTTVPNEKIIRVSTDYDNEDETSSIPEEFHYLSNITNETVREPQVTDLDEPDETNESIQKLPVTDLGVPNGTNQTIQKLQVTDLDVDSLIVNKLVAKKIIVSQIDSSTHDVITHMGNIRIGEINLPNDMAAEREADEIKESSMLSDDVGQKKTSISIRPDDYANTIDNDEQQNCFRNEIQSISLSNIPEDQIAYENSSEQENISCPSVDSNSNEPNIPEDQNAYENSSEQENISCPSADSNSNEPNYFNKKETDLEKIADILAFPSHQQTLFSDEDTSPLTPQTPGSPHNQNLCEELIAKIDDDIQPPNPPPRSLENNTPPRPPRHAEKNKISSSSNQESLQVDDEPPPRPPQPQLVYVPSQPPPSFYALRAQSYVESFSENIPAVPRRRRHAKSKAIAPSSSEESALATPVSRRFHHRRSSELSLGQLSGQLARMCGLHINNSLRRLITYIMNNVLGNEDRKQDLNVMILIALVLIAGLILLGVGDEKTVVHLHHWEYFNPPKDM